MKLNSIIDERLVFCELAGGSREEIYASMLERAHDELDCPLTSQQLLDAVIEREDTLNIPYEGISLPHLRDQQLNDLYI
ncbi:MAG: PTS sugar transporter subunit IIA, partial [Victivallales bacterium]|nr:PTS sugar transporter subunit IIA [Victivallales bacterium]